MRPAIVIPAYDAARTVGTVITGLQTAWADRHAVLGAAVGAEAVPSSAECPTIIVVDDGSSDDTAAVARRLGADVEIHASNRGKGAAIKTGLRAARAAGCDAVVTVDADGQHPPSEAVRLLSEPEDPAVLVLGVRDMLALGAPKKSRVGNNVASFFVSLLTLRRFRDTQCGLRRYPVAATLALRTRDERFGFETEIIMRAARAGVPIALAPVAVVYPSEDQRRTHYRSVVDTLRIILRVHATFLLPWLVGPRDGEAQRRAKTGWAWAVATVLLVLLAIHPAIVLFTRMIPPEVTLPRGDAAVDPRDPDLSIYDGDYARHRGRIWEVALHGDPEEIGARQVRLLRSEMVANETQLWRELELVVPSRFARFLVFDVARLRFRGIDAMMTESRRREVAAAARAFEPDPWDSRIPTYQRMVYLQSLYDVSLSFERSPLIGCTSFGLTGEAAEAGHTLLARNFDFEAGSIFDEHKAVFLVRETGRIPYASVAWPGLVGAVTGMNNAGLALVVHGARAREPVSRGEPLVQTMRDVLGLAHGTDEALKLLGERPSMVSHLVMLADARGDIAIAERAPGEPLWVRRGSGKVPLTNHFEGPLATDPKNLDVEHTTTTLDRRRRLDELLGRLPPSASPAEAVAILRDKRALGGGELTAGDRRAIDASIATHAVVMDTNSRVLWVSEGPHLAGRFVKFDLGRLLTAGHDPHEDREVVALPAEERSKP
jgi:isopenicillin-N N-acyltransferase like protein